MFYATQNQFGLTFDQVRKLYPSKSFPADGQIDTPEASSYVPSTTPGYDPATHAVRETAPAGGEHQPRNTTRPPMPCARSRRLMVCSSGRYMRCLPRMFRPIEPQREQPNGRPSWLNEIGAKHWV